MDQIHGNPIELFHHYSKDQHMELLNFRDVLEFFHGKMHICKQVSNYLSINIVFDFENDEDIHF